MDDVTPDPAATARPGAPPHAAPTAEAPAPEAPGGANAALTAARPAPAQQAVPAAPLGSAATAAPAEACEIGVLTAEGCEASYDVTEEGFVGLTGTCDDGNVTNECGGWPVGLTWSDASTRAPKRVRIAIRTAVYCAPGRDVDRSQTIEINGEAIGSYTPELGDCSCRAAGTERVFELSKERIADYRSGAPNVLQIAGPNRCIGLQRTPAWGGAIARVTVVY